MMGAEYAADNVAKFLEHALPAYLTLMRSQLGIPNDQLPLPKTVTSADLPEIPIEQWPAIIVAPAQMSSFDQTDWSDRGFPRFSTSYDMEIEGYVRSRGFEATGRLNRRYAAAVRGVLSLNKTLRVPDVDWSGVMPTVDVESIREEYAPSFDSKTGRTVASFRTRFTLNQTEEPLHEGPTGMVMSVETTLRRHPAL